MISYTELWNPEQVGSKHVWALAKKHVRHGAEQKDTGVTGFLVQEYVLHIE